MTIRIDVDTVGDEVVVCLAGRLSGNSSKELINTCDQIKQGFVLDLSNLAFADDAGVDVLRAISDQAIKVRGASQFIQLLLYNTSGQESDSENS